MNVYLYSVMETYLVSLGSNENKAENMLRCRKLIETYFQNVSYSEMLETKPVGVDFTEMFYNQLAVISSECALSDIQKVLKQIEKDLGRKSTDKSRGIVIIDLDVLAVNDKIIKSDDFTRPYISCLLSTFDASDSLFYNKEYLKACIHI